MKNKNKAMSVKKWEGTSEEFANAMAKFRRLQAELKEIRERNRPRRNMVWVKGDIEY